MLKYGHIPSNFNVCLVTPIPKKNTLNEPSDARPISVSSVFANLFKSLILNLTNIQSLIHLNQLGYKNNTSCKNVFFLVNETINYYVNGGSSLYLVSLDASKAFDKLWRVGLFYKLKTILNPCIWRILFNYYKNSKIIVKYRNLNSEVIPISEGVKQGGILSPFLFNFFINDLIVECINLNRGALIGDKNMSILGYCDDLTLMSPSYKHMYELLEVCDRFTLTWKLEFNGKKIVCWTFSREN